MQSSSRAVVAPRQLNLALLHRRLQRVELVDLAGVIRGLLLLLLFTFQGFLFRGLPLGPSHFFTFGFLCWLLHRLDRLHLDLLGGGIIGSVGLGARVDVARFDRRLVVALVQDVLARGF